MVERKILLNPGPATTTDTVKMAQVVPDICPREAEFGQVMRELGEGLLHIVHAAPEKYSCVLFCGSGTLVIEACVTSLVPAGKKMLFINNGSYTSRAVEIAEACGVPYLELRLPIDEPADIGRVKQALESDKDIAVVYITHQETGTGLLNPIREIGRIAHAHGAWMVADTISTLAMRPIDIERDNLDFCMSSAQKGIQAMTGLSFLIGRTDCIKASQVFPCHSYYSNIYLQYDSFERSGQMRFTPPVQVIYAARQALKEYFAEGENDKWRRHQKTMAAIHAGLSELGFHEVLPHDYQAGLVAAVLYPDDPNWDFAQVHDYCYVRGFTIYPGKMQQLGTFRICALGAITTRDIRDFFVIFREALANISVTVPVKYE
ncbi:2-aminoethylphosphonate aminotransferase [Selenomonas bovis]|uniref:2-aminoethylphosphonate aminotransferase n=1 Tax=Selenomonas bovis TaxID=416586 RepID=UPI00035D7BDD|nr:2-aminoethylphosphonate aminotransferase [Selenomonas bovis]